MPGGKRHSPITGSLFWLQSDSLDLQSDFEGVNKSAADMDAALRWHDPESKIEAIREF
jgi:hypothetical protein